MSQLVGRIVDSLASGVNKNNISHVNLSLDFALVKIEAPLEYSAVGQCLSPKRKAIAEQGQHHRIARTLGALFAALLPKAQKLRAAFGERASEIIKAPGTNPPSSKKDGPFEAYVGVDATSIWASATSGDPAVFVLLLACMLARNFADSRYSIAAWVEIIQTRRKEVSDSAETTDYLLSEAVVAAQQDIRREDIAAFDSSVRAWLSTADSVMAKRRKQLNLVLDSLDPVHVSFEENTHSRVVSTWVSAIKGLEDILNGKPQHLIDGSILMALSAWHIYPNLVVLSDEAQVVDFEDRLVPRSGAITLGSKAAGPDSMNTGLQWPLTLAHLRYYGPAFDSAFVDKNSRIDIQELQMMVLGVTLARWGIPLRETKTATACILRICERLSEASQDGKGKRNVFSESINEAGVLSDTPYSWIAGLRHIAKKYLSAKEEEENQFDHLIRYGRRLARAFIRPDERDMAFFGLPNKHNIQALRIPPGYNRAVEYLRSCLGSNECWNAKPLQTHDAVIVYETIMQSPVGTFGMKKVRARVLLTVIATLIPYRHAIVDTVSGTSNYEEIHVRWVIVSEVSKLSPRDRDNIKTFIRLGMSQQEHIIVILEKENIGRVLDMTEDNVAWLNPPDLFTNRDTKFRPCTQSLACGNHQCSTLIPPSLPNPSVPTVMFDEVETQQHEVFDSKKRNLADGSDDVRLGPSSGKNISLVPISKRPHIVDVYLCKLKLTEEWHHKSTGLERYSKQAVNSQKAQQTFIQQRLRQCNSFDASCHYSPAELDMILGNENLDPSSLRSYFVEISRSKPLSEDQLLKGHDKGNGDENHGDHDDVAAHHNKYVDDNDGRGILSHVASLTVRQDVLSQTLRNCLHMLNIATGLFAQFPTATFPLGLLESILTKDIKSYYLEPTWKWDIRSALWTICFFETGGIITDLRTFDLAFALSASNSLYVPEILLSDSQETSRPCLVRRITGNLGQPGVSILASPANLMVRGKIENSGVAQQRPFDHSRRDSFPGVSLHLSLTGRKILVHVGEVGFIDPPITLTEAVVSVRDQGDWVADIDVMDTVPHCISTVHTWCSCAPGPIQGAMEKDSELVSIDNFDQLLGSPEKSAVVRANQNWPARLAAACIIRQNNGEKSVNFLPGMIQCWKCLGRDLRRYPQGTIFID